MPRIAENHEPNHPGNEKIIHHHENDDARQILAGARLRLPQSAVLLANHVIPRLRTQKLHQPTAVRYAEADVDVEYGEGGVLVGRLPVDDEGDDGEESEEDADEHAVPDELVDLVVLVVGVERVLAAETAALYVWGCGLFKVCAFFLVVMGDIRLILTFVAGTCLQKNLFTYATIHASV